MRKQNFRSWRTTLRLISMAFFAVFSFALFVLRSLARVLRLWLLWFRGWLRLTFRLRGPQPKARSNAQLSTTRAPEAPPIARPSASRAILPPAPAPEAVELPKVPESRYRVFVPSVARAKASRWGRNRRPLLVLLHGCLQNATTMENGSRMNETAEREGFFVLYPDQARGRNMMNCWNWFDSRNQRPYSGELAEILAMIEQVEAQYAIDHKRIFVAGLSSGATTAAGLLACHPDRFAGGLLHSGAAYASAQGLFEGAHAMRLGPMTSREDRLPADPKLFTGRLMLVQGDRDHVVHSSHQDRLLEQFASPEELAAATSWSWSAPPAEPNAGPELYSAHLTAYGSADRPRICRVTIEGMGHAWSGGKNISFNDPRGPSINDAFARFFLKGELPFPVTTPALEELSGTGRV